MTRRWITGCALCSLLIAIIIAVLAFASAWSPISDARCFTDIAHSQFPKWLGCAIAAHETLAGSLIAAGGALFGAWLAYSGLQDQIGMAQKNELETRRLDQQKRIQDAGRDLDLMRIAHGFVKSLADEFPKVGDLGISDVAFASRLLDLRRRGGLQISLNAKRAPDGNGDSVDTIIGRLNILAENLYQETKTLSADMLPSILRNREDAARTQVAALRDLEQILAAKVPRYEDKFQNAVAQKIG